MNEGAVEKMLLRPTEVADLLGLGRTRVYALIGAREIPSVRIGASVRVPTDLLRQWVDQQIEKTTETNNVEP